MAGKAKKTRLEKAQALLDQMDAEELAALQQAIETHLTASNTPSPANKGGQVGIAQPSTASGHIELKMINGCGPYKYKRVLVGGRLKSVYIGKATQADIKKYGVKKGRGTTKT
ncbi:MAG: hypothetical protein HY862_04895 [Chloroflexi bacterium]|nr:hypothetical protein [Chloroflexota bacterium]